MALFKRKPKSSEGEKSPVVPAPSQAAGVASEGVASVLLRPRVTEKATLLAEKHAYVFEVHPRAGKHAIAQAVKETYHVSPVRVNIVKLPAKRVFVRGKNGTAAAIKKAIVYLKHGDKIELV